MTVLCQGAGYRCRVTGQGGVRGGPFRRRFLQGRPVRWFVYLTAPESRLAAVTDLGPAIVDVPEQIEAIAEAARPGNGAMRRSTAG